MFCRLRFLWTNAQHDQLQQTLTRHSCACRSTWQFPRNKSAQWPQCLTTPYSSQSKTPGSTAKGRSPSAKRGGAKATKRSAPSKSTSLSSGEQASRTGKEDMATKLMHHHRDSIRRLKAQHLPPSPLEPHATLGRPKEHTRESTKKNQHSRRKFNGHWRESNIFPVHFRNYSRTEKIETLDTKSVRDLFVRQQDTFFHASGTVFTIKATRRRFAEPEPTRLPPFALKALEAYEQEYDVFNRALQRHEFQLEQRQLTTTVAGSVSMHNAEVATTPVLSTTKAGTAPTTTTLPSQLYELSPSTLDTSVKSSPPPLPFTLQQFLHKPLRSYPPTRESVHSSFRVSVLSPKKTISKLAVYRTLCRRKFYQAIENVFRGRARTGFDYLIFAGKDSLLTPQARLEQLLIDALADSRLHGEKMTRKPPSAAGSSGEGSERRDNGGQRPTSPRSPRLRYKDDKKPPFNRFWKHGLPNPLPRKLYQEHYLDRYADKGNSPDSPEQQRAVVLRQRQGMWVHRRRVLNKENQLKAVQAARERDKVLAQHHAFVASLIQKHFTGGQ